MPDPRVNREELERIWNLVEQNPGITPAQIGMRVGLDTKSVERRLTTMENWGYLMTEDQKKGLYPWQKQRGRK